MEGPLSHVCGRCGFQGVTVRIRPQDISTGPRICLHNFAQDIPESCHNCFVHGIRPTFPLYWRRYIADIATDPAISEWSESRRLARRLVLSLIPEDLRERWPGIPSDCWPPAVAVTNPLDDIDALEQVDEALLTRLKLRDPDIRSFWMPDGRSSLLPPPVVSRLLSNVGLCAFL